MFLRKFKKYANDDSINRTIKYNKNGNELKVGDIIRDEKNIEEEYSQKERNYIIKEIIKDLSTIDREIIMLQFGFYNNETYIQKEIAKKLSISQSLVSKLTQKILKQIQEKLEEKELIDSNLIQVQKNKIKQKKK